MPSNVGVKLTSMSAGARYAGVAVARARRERLVTNTKACARVSSRVAAP